MSSRWVGLRARDHRLCRLPRSLPSGVVAAHSVTYRGGSASASHRLPCSTERIFLRRSISNDFDEIAFDPRKKRDGSLGQNEVKLPGVAVAQPTGVPTPGERKAQQIVPAHVEQVVYSKAQSQAAFEQFDTTTGREDGACANPEGLRKIDIVVLRPSVDLGRLAGEYEAKLPGAFRFLTRGLGTRETKSPDFLSLLMFQPDYLRRLIEIGEQDADAHLDKMMKVLQVEA